MSTAVTTGRSVSHMFVRAGVYEVELRIGKTFRTRTLLYLPPRGDPPFTNPRGRSVRH